MVTYKNVKQEAARLGLHVARYGGRYKFFPAPADYFEGDGLYVATSSREAMAFLAGVAAERQRKGA